MSVPSKLKAKHAGEPWLGCVVVGGVLPYGVENSEGESGIPIAEVGPTLTTDIDGSWRAGVGACVGA